MPGRKGVNFVDYEASYQLGDGAAQQLPPEAAAGIMAFAGAFAFVIFLVAIVFYVYFALCHMKIAKRTNTPNAWMAWVPIAQIILMLQVAKKPIWWIIMFLIPVVNIVFGVLVWMAVAKTLGRPEWMGILLALSPLVSIIPFVGAIASIAIFAVILGIFAFGNTGATPKAVKSA